MMGQADFGFAPGVRARIAGPDAIVDAFRREYAPLEAVDRTDPSLEIRFGRASSQVMAFEGRHKTVAWRVSVSPAAAVPIQIGIDLSGAPRSFARSLVQGYVVEPMISVVAVDQGLVLVPSAGVADERGVTVILGRSGAGKSTLMARLAATGRDVLGDDQLFVDVAGGCRAFPRRLRFYPDIESTAPEAFARMPGGIRRRLRLRKALAAATLDYVRPSLGIDREAIGARWVPGPLDIGRVVLLERSEAGGGLRVEAATVDDALGWAARLLAEQRARLRVADDAAWRGRLETVTAAERSILRTAFEGRIIQRLMVPREGGASEAVSAVAEQLGFAI
jgi:hypothetical protein